MRNLSAYQSSAYGANSYQGSAYGPLSAAVAALPFSNHPTLSTGLLAYWKMDEASGDRIDSVSSQILSPVNAPGSEAGKIANAAKFVKASSQKLTGPNLFPADATRFVMAWVKPAASDAYGIFSAHSSDGSVFSLWYDYGDVALTAANTTRGNGGPAPNTWLFITAYHDAVANTIGIMHNLVNWATTSTGGPNGAGDELQVGFDGSTYFGGDVDELGIWDRVLTEQEILDSYNLGSGLTY